MSTAPAGSPSSRPGVVVRAVEAVGAAAATGLRAAASSVAAVGGMAYLFYDCLGVCARTLLGRKSRVSGESLATQMVRVGVRSIGIVCLVQIFIGAILALQLAPTLESYGQLQQIATVVAIAVVRELGPLITAIVLSGFAGASIAAEIGAMVEAEEIKALRAHALDPVRFLIVPRFLATVMMIVGLAVIADIVGVTGGLLTSWAALGIDPQSYLDMTQTALVTKDFVTGLVKAGVFGVLISMIACYEGLNVSGGAEGVGSATTATVVKCIVAIIGTDAVFTAIFYVFEL